MNKPTNILYVDDCEADIELFKIALNQYSNIPATSLDVATTVEEATKIFNPQKHKSAVLDWNLPDGEGLEVAEHIRTLTPNTSIIFLSSFLTKTHLQKAQTVSAKACLEKETCKKNIIETVME